MKKLQVGFDAMLRATPTAFHKYMFNRINWNNPSTVRTIFGRVNLAPTSKMIFLYYPFHLFTLSETGKAFPPPMHDG